MMSPHQGAVCWRQLHQGLLTKKRIPGWSAIAFLGFCPRFGFAAKGLSSSRTISAGVSAAFPFLVPGALALLIFLGLASLTPSVELFIAFGPDFFVSVFLFSTLRPFLGLQAEADGCIVSGRPKMHGNCNMSKAKDLVAFVSEAKLGTLDDCTLL